MKRASEKWFTRRPLSEFAGIATLSVMAAGRACLTPPTLLIPFRPKDSLKYSPDYAPVSVNGAIVSAVFDFDGDSGDFYYVEKPNRSFGIWVMAPATVSAGDLVDVKGVMTGGYAERAIVPETVDVLGNGYPRPSEVGLTNKALGGGAAEPFTPAVGGATGLNNTGLLVKVWGRLTYVDDYYPIYYIDDGSNVTADWGIPGVKVYDPYWLYPPPYPIPTDYAHVVSGISSAEIPYGESTSIRTIWATDPVIPATGPGYGTISGTITATGADGMTARTSCAWGSAIAVFSGNTASYSNLSTPTGNIAVTASLPGYKTTTQLVTVTTGSNTADFTLSSIQRVVDLVPSPARVAPGGGDITITAIVRDEEGRRFGSEAVTWTRISCRRGLSARTPRRTSTARRGWSSSRRVGKHRTVAATIGGPPADATPNTQLPTRRGFDCEPHREIR